MRPERRGRGLATLLLGSTGGQAAGLLAAPLLTRLFDPAAFGALGVFQAVVGLVGGIACLGLDQAMVLERDPIEARRAYGLALAASLAVAAASLPAALLLGRARLLPGLPPAAFALLPVAIGLQAASQVLAARALALAAHRAVAGARFARGAAVGAVQLGLAALLPRDGATLLLGATGGQLVAAATALALIARTPGPLLGPRPARRALLARNRTLLAWSTPQSLLNNAGNAVVPVAVARLSGAPAAGDYALAARVTLLPAVTVGEAMRQSLLATMAGLAGADALRAAAGRATLSLVALMLPAAIAAFALAPALFALVFGARWRLAGAEAAWLFAAQAAGIVNIPAVTAIAVRRWQHGHLLYQSATIPLRLLGLCLGCALSGPAAGIAAYAALSVLASGALTLSVLRRLGRPAGARAAATPDGAVA